MSLQLAGAIDLNLLRKNAHSPSFFALTRGASGQDVDLVDFCIPCNPYFPTPEMFGRLGHALESILKYYPSDADTITAELCGTLGLNPQTVAMGNGSTELITWIDHLLVRESLAIPIPTFGRWTDQPMETGKRVDMYPLQEEQGYHLGVDAYVRFIRQRGSRVAVICNPNNPDGGYLPRQEVIRLLDQLIDLDLVVVDESFIDFVGAEAQTSVADEAALRPNVIVLKSLGKNFGLHGIRFGYLVANPALAGTIRKAVPKWNLNAFAEIVVFLLKEHQEEYRTSLQLVAHDRRMMIQQLSTLPGLTVFPSQGNFVMIKLPDGLSGVALRDYLISEHGVFVRECGNKLGSTSQFLRLVVRPQQDVQRLLTGLGAFLYGTDKARPLYAVNGWNNDHGGEGQLNGHAHHAPAHASASVHGNTGAHPLLSEVSGVAGGAVSGSMNGSLNGAVNGSANGSLNGAAHGLLNGVNGVNGTAGGGLAHGTGTGPNPIVPGSTPGSSPDYPDYPATGTDGIPRYN